jgi:hypothetical protein
MRHLKVVLCWAAVVFAANGNTTLVLSNGDRLKGSLIREKDGRVHFDSDILGEVKLQKDQIKEMIPVSERKKKAKQPIVSIAKATSSGRSEAKPTPKPKKNWSGNVGLSMNKRHAEYERRSRSGSALRRYEKDSEQLRLSAKLKWDKERHHLEWNGNYAYSQSEKNKNNDLHDWTQRYRYDLGASWFGQSETSYERNYVRILEREIQQSVGLGWYPVKTPKLTIDLVPGVNYYYRNQAGEQSEGVLPILQQSLISKLNKSLSFFQKFSYIGSSDEYYYKFNIGLDNRLVKNLFLRFEYRYEIDAQVEDNADPFIQRQVLSSFQYRF